MNEVFLTFLSLSLSGSLLVLAMLLLKPFIKARLSRQWQYYIWIVVIARLLLPFSPVGSFTEKAFKAISNVPIISQAQPSQSYAAEPVMESPLSDEGPTEFDSALPEQVPSARAQNNPVYEAAALFKENYWLIWLTVAMALLIRKITVYRGFVRYVKAGLRPVPSTGLLDRIAEIGSEIHVRGAVELCVNPLVSSPLLLGFFRPCIVIPSTAISNRDFRHTILHELTHYKRRDMFFKWLVQITICLHWFNPLVYLMGREVNKACEFSCDEAVVSRLGAAQAPEYGETLLESMAAVGHYKEALASVTLSENKKMLKERLVMIVNYRKKTALTVYASVFITALLLCGFMFTGAYAASKNSNATGQPDVKIYQNEAWGDFSIEKIGPVSFQAGDSLQADLYWGKAGEVMLLYTDRDSSEEEILVPIQGLRGIPKPDYNKVDENILGSMSGRMFNFKRSYTAPDKSASLLKWDEKVNAGTYWIYIMRIGSPKSISGNISRVKASGYIEALWVRLGRDASGNITSAFPAGAATDAGQATKTAKAPIDKEIGKPNLDMSIQTANVRVINAADNHVSVSYDPAFYRVAVVNTDGNLSVDIKNKLQNMSEAPDVTLYLPKIEYGNIKLDLESATISLPVAGGNITASAHLSDVILQLQKGYSGSVKYTSKAGALYVYSADKYANNKVKITNESDITGDISVPDVFAKNGKVYTYNDGTQKNAIDIVLQEFGSVVFKMGTPSRYREQVPILEEPIIGTNAVRPYAPKT